MKRMKKISFNSDKIFDIVNLLIMVLLLIIFVWPLWFVLIASVSDPAEVWRGNVILFPVNFTLDAYKEVIQYEEIWRGYLNTFIYTGVGTAVNMVMTVCGAYPLSRKDFVPRNIFMVILLITMYFNGGLIPTYMVVSRLGQIGRAHV